MIFDIKKSSLYRTHKKCTTTSIYPTSNPTISQEQFLQADDGDIDKILPFSTTENLLHLCAAETIYCDGTKKCTIYTTLQMFDQIFTIHALVGDVMFPLVFSLLPGRDTATYNKFFTLLKDIASRHNFNFIPE